MITFTYNNVDFSYLLTVHSIEGRGTLSSFHDVSEVPGKPGVYLHRKHREARYITIRVSLQSRTPNTLRSLVDIFNAMIDLDEPAPLVFSDEPEMTYYAVLDGSVDWEEDRAYAFADLTFVCPDPFKYGPLNTVEVVNDDSIEVEIGGTAPTKPIISIVPSAPSSYLMAAKGDDAYIMVGEPVDAGVSTVDRLTSVLSAQGTTLTGWSTPNPSEVSGAIDGTVSTETGRFIPYSYGSGSGWHGPALKQTVTTTQDFSYEVSLRSINTNKNALGKIEFGLLDAQGNVLCQVVIGNTAKGVKRTRISAAAGKLNGGRVLMSRVADNKTNWNEFDGVIRVERVGNRWSVFVGEYGSVSLGTKTTMHARAKASWVDTANAFAAPVTQVVFQFQQYGTSTVIATQNIATIKLSEVNTTATPKNVSDGSEVVFDHVNNEIAIGTLDARKYKDFGASFFALEPGPNMINVSPVVPNTFTIQWRNAYK